MERRNYIAVEENIFLPGRRFSIVIEDNAIALVCVDNPAMRKTLDVESIASLEIMIGKRRANTTTLKSFLKMTKRVLDQHTIFEVSHLKPGTVTRYIGSVKHSSFNVSRGPVFKMS